MKTAAFHQREPGGETGARQRAGFRVVKGRRCANEPVLREGDIFGQYAGMGAAQRPIRRHSGVAKRLAVDPARREGRDHAVAGCKTGCARSDGCHGARHVGGRREGKT
jgi:hypothetical protein